MMPIVVSQIFYIYELIKTIWLQTHSKFQAETYSIQAESRGKELKVHLHPQNDDEEPKKKSKKKATANLPQQSVKHLLFRFGMSGCFKLTSVKGGEFDLDQISIQIIP